MLRIRYEMSGADAGYAATRNALSWMGECQTSAVAMSSEVSYVNFKHVDFVDFWRVDLQTLKCVGFAHSRAVCNVPSCLGRAPRYRLGRC